MNLGNIYLKAFALILIAAFIIALSLASTLRMKRFSWQTVILIALPIWIIAGYFLLDFSHQQLFTTWHRWQNSVLPNRGCLTYEPQFTRLYASYEMSREAFTSWVASHPWNLQPGSNSLLHRDGPHLGIDHVELSYETPTAPNGKQMRVYFTSDTMYVSYNSN